MTRESTAPKLILASSSLFRQKMLQNAGLDFQSFAADLPESDMMLDWQSRGIAADIVARKLAVAKAAKISAQFQGAVVIGCDQMMICGQRWFAKPQNRDEAMENLQFLSGKTHQLISGIALVQDGETLWEFADFADMTMRVLSDKEIQNYLNRAGDSVLRSVGAYQIESIGVGLFEKISGDYFSIIGLPLLPLLNELQRRKWFGDFAA